MSFNLKVLIPIICIIFSLGCGGGSDSGGYTTPSGDTPSADNSNNDSPSALTLTSNNYTNGNSIPLLNACTALGGTDTSPQLSWAFAPVDTGSFALIMEDETPPCGTGSLACVHWALFNIPETIYSLEAGLDTSTIEGVVEGYTYLPTTSYEGPCPPSTHNYKTTVYALDYSMPVIPVNSTFTRSTFEVQYSSNILDQAEIMGTFNPDTSTPQETFSVSVAANNNGSGNVYVIDGQQKKSLTLNPGTKYIFSHPAGHPLRFSTTADGTHGNGSEYTAGVDRSASGITEIEVSSSTPVTLYYYCSLHAGMGGVATTSGGDSYNTNY
jgi:Raf kinase inhibitor-like YbhB/YbcL family protein